MGVNLLEITRCDDLICGRHPSGGKNDPSLGSRLYSGSLRHCSQTNPPRLLPVITFTYVLANVPLSLLTTSQVEMIPEPRYAGEKRYGDNHLRGQRPVTAGVTAN